MQGIFTNLFVHYFAEISRTSTLSSSPQQQPQQQVQPPEVRSTSSTDSFTDPIDFDTELNACYYSEENVSKCVVHQQQESAAAATMPIPTIIDSADRITGTADKLQKLTISAIDIFNNSIVMTDHCHQLPPLASVVQPPTKIQPLRGSEKSTSLSSYFNVARAQKTELHTHKVTGECDVLCVCIVRTNFTVARQSKEKTIRGE